MADGRHMLNIAQAVEAVVQRMVRSGAAQQNTGFDPVTGQLGQSQMQYNFPARTPEEMQQGGPAPVHGQKLTLPENLNPQPVEPKRAEPQRSSNSSLPWV